MAIFDKLSGILGLNSKITGQFAKDTAKVCARHPERKAIGVCKYCERELCSECLVSQKGYHSCSNGDDCLQYQECPRGSAEKCEKLIQELKSAKDPNIQLQIAIQLAKLGNSNAVTPMLDYYENQIGIGQYVSSGEYKKAVSVWKEKGCLDNIINFLKLDVISAFKMSDNQSSVPKPPSMKAIIDALESLSKTPKSLYNKEIVLLALGSRKNSDVETLIQGLREDNDENIRIAAAKALGEIRDAAAVGPLTSALQERSVYVRVAAIQSLGDIGAPSSVDSLMTIFFKDDNKAVQTSAMETLEKKFTTLDPLIQILTNSDSEYKRSLAAHLIGLIGDIRAKDYLNKALSDQNSGVRKAAQVALAKLR